MNDSEDYQNLSQTSSFGWLIDSSEISPGASAILGNNTFAFYAIHHVALFIITLSVAASLIVVHRIHTKWKNFKSKLDFPIRFPLYLAIADTLWGISHFTDHLYLVTVRVYPEVPAIKLAFSMILWFFFGYQQLMHASIATYTYLRVVHRKKLNLGKWEWKLHFLWFSFLAISIVLFYFMESFGNTGYWMAHDPRTVNGQILGVIIALTSTFNACCTTLGYYTIQKTVDSLKKNLQLHKSNEAPKSSSVQMPGHQSVASKCLTTYVRVASFLYCPLAILLWINVLFQIFLGVVEPFSCLLIIIVANSSGWANAYAYFYNERLKKENEHAKKVGSQPNSIVSSTIDSFGNIHNP